MKFPRFLGPLSGSSSAMRTLVTGVAASIAIGSTSSAAIMATGMNSHLVSVYSNPFSAATATTDQTASQALANVVNGRESRMTSGSVSGRIEGNAATGYMRFALGGPVAVGTVITSHSVGAGFDSPMAHTVLLDNQPIASGSGTQDIHEIKVTPLASLATGSTLELDFSLSSFGGSTTKYADFNEILVLPDTLERIPLAGTPTVSSTSFGTAAGLYDLTGGLATNGGWAGTSGSSPMFELDFGSVKTINALLVADYENALGVDVDILNDLNVVVANVVTTNSSASAATYGDFGVIKFITPVSTSKLTFQFHDTTGHTSGLREVIAFTVVPEPAALSLFVAGSFAIWLTGRRRR